MLHFAKFFLRLYCRGDRFLQLYHELNLQFNCSIEAINKAVFSHFSHMCTVSDFLWSPYVIGRPLGLYFAMWFLSSIFFFSSPNLSGRRLDVYHTSTDGVALVRI